jgi:hypothetical protein
MMSKVVIKSANTGAKLEFLDVMNEYLTVEFSSPAFTVFHRVWLYDGDGKRLAQLFHEMAQDWRGWEGIKSWGAIEGDFNLSCSSDKLGHITLEIELVERGTSESWSAQFNMEIEAGQLEKIAHEMAALLRNA